MSLYSRLDRIAADVEKLNRQVNSAANAPQSQRTSVEGGSIDFNDADGNLKAIVGMQDDGGYTTNVVSGPTPPTPTNFTVEVDYGKIVVHWDGSFGDALVAPTDWARAEVYAQEGQFVTPSRELARGSMVAASGGEVTVGVLKGQWTVCMAGWSQAGIMSPMSAPVTVEVPGYGDLVQETLDDAQELIDQAKEQLEEAQAELDTRLDGVDGTLNDLGQDIAAVEDAQAQLNTDLSDVMTSVDGKNTITWNPSAPSKVSNPGKAVGDMWYRTSGNSIVGFWKWDGTDWVTQLLDKTTIPLIDIGTGTFGALAGSRLAVESVTADKLLIGGASNMIANPSFESGSAGWVMSNVTPDTTVAHSGSQSAKMMGSSGTQSMYQSQKFNVVAGDTYRVSVWAMVDDATGTSPNGGGFRIHSANTDGTPGAEYQDGWVSDRNWSHRGWDTPGEWFWLETQWVAPVTDAVIIRIAFTSYHTRGTRWVDDFAVVPMTDSTLITPGAVTTPKLAADVLEVRNLKATSGQLNEAVINKLFSDVVVAKTSVANAFIGENAILTGAVTAPKITASEELTAKVAEFLRVRAEMIEADAIDGMVITAPTIQSARSGRRWVASTDSIRVIDSNDDVRTQLSPEGSTFKGEVEADTLVVNEGAEFKANNTLAQGAKFTLAAGVTDPTAPPVVQPYWDGLEFTSANINGSNPVGLAWDGTNYITVGANRATSGVTSYFTGVYAMKINGATGEASRLRCDFSAASESESRVSEVFGVTCIGSELFFLGRYGYAGYVWVTDLDGVFKRRFSYPDISYSATNRLVYRPGIGNNGTHLVIAQCNDSGVLFLRTYNKTTGAKISDVGNEPNDGTKSDITGVHVGTADWGRSLATVAKSSNSKLPSFNPTTGVYDGATTQFDAASNKSVGVVFVDGKFRTLDPSGVIHEYADNTTGDNSGDWWGTYYWYTDVNGNNVIESSDYRSRMAPPARFTWPRRAMLKILGQPMPTGVEALGPALAKKTTTPVRTDFSGPPWSVDTGKPSARYTEIPANWTTYASPSDTNTYPEATSSALESASGTFRVRGDGSGHWGPLKMGRNGVMSGLVVTGQASCAVTTAGTPRKFTIQLPAGRFTKPPVVWLSPLTSSPQNVAVSVVGADITTTSFALWFWRNDLSGTGVDWFAMDAE